MTVADNSGNTYIPSLMNGDSRDAYNAERARQLRGFQSSPLPPDDDDDDGGDPKWLETTLYP